MKPVNHEKLGMLNLKPFPKTLQGSENALESLSALVSTSKVHTNSLQRSLSLRPLEVSLGEREQTKKVLKPH